MGHSAFFQGSFELRHQSKEGFAQETPKHFISYTF